MSNRNKPSLINRIFGKEAGQLPSGVRALNTVELINSGGQVFHRHDGNIYEDDIIRSAVDAIARHASKAKAEVIGDSYKDLSRLVQVKPNEFQTGSEFIRNIVTILKVTSTCYIVPIYADDEETIIRGFYPINPQQAELVSYKGILFMRYRFNNGSEAVIEFDRVGIMTDRQYKSDIVGESNTNALSPLLTLLDQQRQAIEYGMQQGSQLKFSAALRENLQPEDRKKIKKEFKEENMSMDGSGLLLTDNRFVDVTQLKPDTFIVDAEQLDFVKTGIYNYFGVNQDILQSSYTEEVWSAFYEGAIEPILLQLSQVLTIMTFTEAEIIEGKQWIFTTNRLQYASNQTKLDVSQTLFDRGLITTNQVLDIWNMAHVEDGDKRYIRKEYAEMLEGQEQGSEPLDSQELDQVVKEAIENYRSKNKGS